MSRCPAAAEASVEKLNDCAPASPHELKVLDAGETMTSAGAEIVKVTELPSAASQLPPVALIQKSTGKAAAPAV